MERGHELTSTYMYRPNNLPAYSNAFGESILEIELDDVERIAETKQPMKDEGSVSQEYTDVMDHNATTSPQLLYQTD